MAQETFFIFVFHIDSRAVKKYWAWWGKNAPIHCRDIRTAERDSRVCLRLGKLAAVEIENLIR